MNTQTQKQIRNLAEEYNKGIISHDEIQDVLMGIEHTQRIDYEELYKTFTNEIQET